MSIHQSVLNKSTRTERAAPARAHIPLRAVCFAILVTALTVSTAAVPPVAFGAVAAVTVLPAPAGSGAFVGSAQTSAMASFSTWRGNPTDLAVDYLSSTNWADLETPKWWLTRWSGVGLPLVLAVPMLMNDPATTLQRGAAGEYDAHYRKLAASLVQYGYNNVSLRVGWEMNGSWYRWSAYTDPTAWNTYYRRIVDVMRSVPGQAFRFDWTLSLGSSRLPVGNAYPGDAYVDYVGADVYDWKWGAGSAQPAERWSWIKTQLYGLDWIAAFAAAHGKQLTIPEWGLAPKTECQNGGGGDDPLFVNNMLTWINNNGVKYESYFNWNERVINTGRYPNAAAAYRAAMSG